MKARGIGHYFHSLGELRKTNYDAVLDFQGRIKSAFILLNLNAKEKMGFNKLNVQEGFVTRLYSRSAEPMPYRLHVIRQNLKLLELVGLDHRLIHFPEIRFDPAAVAAVNSWLRENSLKDFIIVNPFTSWLTKNWPPKHVAEFCSRVEKVTGLQPVLLWGPGESEKAKEMQSKTSAKCLLAPQTTQAELTFFLSRASAYVGGDTGPSHLSAALGVKTVYLFGPTDPLRNGPFDKRDRYLHAQINCSKCTRKKCQGHDHHSLCMEALTPTLVLETLAEML